MTKGYRPSNGTEGEWFMGRYCYQCDAFGGLDDDDPVSARSDDPCPILGDALAGLQVEQWIETARGPHCTAFRDNGEPGPIDPDAVVRPLL